MTWLIPIAWSRSRQRRRIGNRRSGKRAVVWRFFISARHVANWLAERAQAGQAYATLRNAIAAVRAGHVAHGLGFDTRHPAIETVMRLARAKTARAGEVETVTIPRAPVASAIAAVERWIAAAGIQPGEPILRRVTKGGKIGARLTDQSVRNIVKARIAEHHQRHGVPRDVAEAAAEKFTAHSLRTGFAVSAAEAGATADEIALVTRHRSLEMPRRYAAKADALRRSP